VTAGGFAADAGQERYARWLARGTRLGFAMLVLGFLAYVAEAVEAHVPIDRLPDLWHLPAEEFLVAAGIEPGWGWSALAHRGDLMNLVGIAVLATASVPCLLAVVPVFRARGERALAAICVLEVAVLLLAASGLLTGGH
jgi:hypothetical protein